MGYGTKHCVERININSIVQRTKVRIIFCFQSILQMFISKQLENSIYTGLFADAKLLEDITQYFIVGDAASRDKSQIINGFANILR